MAIAYKSRWLPLNYQEEGRLSHHEATVTAWGLGATSVKENLVRVAKVSTTELIMG